jgi:flagellar motor switch protein FliG
MSANLPVSMLKGGKVAAGDPAGARDPADAAREATAAAARALSMADKAAIIMAALGPDAAPRVLQGASEATMRRFAQAMSGLWRISPDVLDKTIADFTEALGANHDVRGGASEARRMLRELLDDDSVSRIMDDVEAGGARTLWERLSNSSDQALAGFLRHEHPQTATVVLSKMRSDKAARILERLDPEFAQVVVLRLARVPRLDSEVMAILTEVITNEFLAVMQREQATRRPADVIGSMMNNVSAANRGRLLQQLEQEKPKLARQVQKVMFTFLDIADRVEPRDASLLLKAVDEPTMMRALKFAEHNAPKVLDFFLFNLSKRLAQRLEGDLKLLGDISPRDGEAAQSEVVRMVRELSQSGEIKVLEAEEEE